MNCCKTIFRALAFACVWAVSLANTSRAQEIVLSRGPHHEVRQGVVVEDGVGQTNTFTLLRNGVGYWSEATQKWEASSDQIELTENGAKHEKGPIKVHFPANYNDANNPVRIEMADGRRLKLRTAALVLTDHATGDSVEVGTLRNAPGFLMSDGTGVVYSDAFIGVSASIRVKVGIGYVENDVVLHESISAEDFGLNPQTTSLEVFHEFLEDVQAEAQPQAITRSNGVQESDIQIKMGEAMIGRGTAFLLGNDEAPVRNNSGPIQVRKEIYSDPVARKKYLIEGVPIREARDHLRALPDRTEARLDLDGIKRDLKLERALAKGTQGRRSPLTIAGHVKGSNRKGETIAAAIQPARGERPGLLIDYTVVSSATNLRLSGGETYLVNNTAVSVTGTLTIEGGTVVKYTGSTAKIDVSGAVVCETDLYSPATFTAREDRSLGQAIAPFDASGYHGDTYLRLSGSGTVNLSHIRMRHAKRGVVVSDTANLVALDFQAINCERGIVSDLATYSGTPVKVRNYLAHGTAYPLVFDKNNNVFHVEHLTANTATKLAEAGAFTGSAATLVNSVQVGVANASSGVSFTSTQVVSGNANTLESVLAGSNYLADAAYRDIGSTTLSTEMKALLNKTTTMKPMVLAGAFHVDTTLRPTVLRDRETAPDLGYHYPPVDYIGSWAGVYGGVTVRLADGVCIAGHGQGAFAPATTSKLVSVGAPGKMNVLTTYNSVQEQPARHITGDFHVWYGQNVDLSFTHFASPTPPAYANKIILAAPFHGTIRLANCLVERLVFTALGTMASGYTTHVHLFNNVFVRSGANIEQGTSQNQPAFVTAIVRNNLFKDCLLYLNHHGEAYGEWIIYDNFFDGVNPMKIENDSNGLTYGGWFYPLCNAYSGGTAVLGGSGNKTGITGSYVSGTFGRYYYASTGSITGLVNMGSDMATNLSSYAGATGLTHYTTSATAGSKEGTSQLDIGPHYVASDSSGKPIDTDGDGLPDYIEDANGNGSHDPSAGETNLNSSNTAGTGAAGLILFTPLR